MNGSLRRMSVATAAVAVAMILTMSLASMSFFSGMFAAEASQGDNGNHGHEKQMMDSGIEPNHRNDWLTANHDIYGSRNSDQTIIGKNNVDKLQVKWTFNDDVPIENSPIIVKNKAFVLDNDARVFAFNAKTGRQLWELDTGGEGNLHGMTYYDGALYVPTGHKATIVSVDPSDGSVNWESLPLGQEAFGYHTVNPPIVWQDYVIAGSAGGDFPPHPGVVQGNVTALSRTDGHVIWSMRTTTGDWVSPDNVPPNGGATTWSGGSFDPETGILYLPAGNATPDFNASTRPLPNLYVNHMLAIDITTGEIIWATPFLAEGTSLPNATVPDTHDWDTSWGSTLSKVTMPDGEETKIVIGTDKKGDVMAMDAATGQPMWSTILGTTYNTDSAPATGGSGEVWPGTQNGVEAYHAADENTAYFATSSMGFNYYLNETDPLHGYVVPEFDAIDNGIGNGTITALNMATGETKWVHATEFPTWVSPTVTNGLVFSGHITATGKPYEYNVFGAPTKTPIPPSGIIMALDKETGETLWQYDVGGPIGIGGPSIGQGMLFVPVGSPAELPVHDKGAIVAFGIGG